MTNKSHTQPKHAFLGYLLGVFLIFGGTAVGQSEVVPAPSGEPKAEEPVVAVTVKAPIATVKPAAPFVKELVGVTLGMSIDEILDKLGKPDTKDQTGMVFATDGRSVQIGLDEAQTVRSIAVIYTDAKTSPSYADTFGPVTEPKTGDVYELKRYTDAGYWVSYSRTNSATSPMVVVMMRRLPK